jgi:hypothetical protein
MWILLTACEAEPERDGSESPQGLGLVSVARDEVSYDLTVDGVTTTLHASGSLDDPFERLELGGCSPSVQFSFFATHAFDPDERDSWASFYLTGLEPGSIGTLPPLEVNAWNWPVPTWLLEGRFIGAFEGTAEVTTFTSERVAVTVHAPLLCELPAAGTPSAPILYSDLVEDCWRSGDVVLDAVATTEPFAVPTAEEVVTGSHFRSTPPAWTDGNGSPLCVPASTDGEPED